MDAAVPEVALQSVFNGITPHAIDSARRGKFGYQQGMIAIIEVVEVDQNPSPTPATYTIEAFDFGFRNVPQQMHLGSALELVNESTSEIHNLAVSKLTDDETRTIEELMALPPEAFFSDAEGTGSLEVDMYVGVIHARPGEPAYDGRVRINTPGRFLIVDLVPQGADVGAVVEAVAGNVSPMSVPGGLVGYQQGMIAIIEVVE